MTLYDEMAKENNSESRTLKSVGFALKLCLKQAIRKGRLSCGMTQCAQLLSSELPAAIMLCLLPEDCTQVNEQIHHTLIQAYCYERGIPVIHIKNPRKVENLIHKTVGTDQHSKLNAEFDDLSCFLIKHSTKKPTKEDNILIRFYEEKINKEEPCLHSVDLPA